MLTHEGRNVQPHRVHGLIARTHLSVSMISQSAGLIVSLVNQQELIGSLTMSATSPLGQR